MLKYYILTFTFARIVENEDFFIFVRKNPAFFPSIFVAPVTMYPPIVKKLGTEIKNFLQRNCNKNIDGINSVSVTWLTMKHYVRLKDCELEFVEQKNCSCS